MKKQESKIKNESMEVDAYIRAVSKRNGLRKQAVSFLSIAWVMIK